MNKQLSKYGLGSNFFTKSPRLVIEYFPSKLRQTKTMGNNKDSKPGRGSPLILTIDFGTQSVRAAIFDDKGECLAGEKKEYEPPYFSSKPGYAEQDPDYYFACLCECTKHLSSTYPELIERVAGLTMTCFRDSAVLLDKDLNVIRPMILWLDQRYAKCEDPLPLWSRALFRLVGMTGAINLNRRRTIANWIKENEPQNFAKIHKYVAISTYFIYKLTGKLVDSPSDYTGHYPINYRKKRWYKHPTKHYQGQIFSIRRDQLCELVDPEKPLGEITKQASEITGLPLGLTLYAAGSDKSCETLGSGVIDETMASLSYGTACSIESTSRKFAHPAPFLPSYPSVLPSCYNIDLQVYRGYWTINWFLKEFGAMNINDLIVDIVDPAEYDKRLLEIPPGSDGLILQPFWGSQLDKPEVKGSIIGFSDSTTKFHVYKALVEGIAYELRVGFERFEKKLNTKFDSLRIAGGGSKSDAVCQVTADVFGVPVTRVQTNETSSLGAAMIGFLSIGHFKDEKEAVEAMVHVSKTFIPNKEKHAVYDELFYGVYCKLYKRLKKTYKFLFDFTAGKRN